MTRTLALVTAVLVLAVPSVARPWAPPAQATFSDVPTNTAFFTPIEAVAEAGIMSGYACGTVGEPCDAQNRPYFRQYNNVTRAQLAKVVSIAANLDVSTPPAQASFEDLAPAFPFYAFVEAAFAAGYMGGYSCGGPGEPCDAQNRPYFRPFNNVTRGQTARAVALAAGFDLTTAPAVNSFADVPPNAPFYAAIEALADAGYVSGYTCGSPGEPCDVLGRPYFRPYANITRAQVAKVVANALVFSDTTAPTLVVPGAVVVDATSAAGATVTYVVTSTDPDDPVRQTSCTPASGSTFSIGATTVTCTTEDTHLNTSTATFVVTVNGAVAQLDALIRALDGSSLAKPLVYARIALERNDAPEACTWLAEFDRQAVKSPKLLAASARIETVVGCRR